MPAFRWRRLLVGVVLIGFILGCRESGTRASDSPGGRPTSQQQAAQRKLVYDESADAHAVIDETIAEANADGKRVLLVFGANWCTDCIALDARFHEPPVKPIIDAGFHVVHIDIGRGSTAKHLDLAKKYETNVDKGIPAVAVLDSDGKLLHSQKDGEWAPKGLKATVIVEFLNRWKPVGH